MKFYLYKNSYREGPEHEMPTDAVEIPQIPGPSREWTWKDSKWIENSDAYIYRRRAEYPTIEKQLQSIFLALRVIFRSGEDLPNDTMAMLETIEKINDKYPPPEK